MKKSPHNLWRKTEGSTIIEFALALPVFLLLTFGVIDLGFLFYQRASLSYALSEMSRYVFIKPTASESEIITYARSRIVPLGQSIQFSATLSPGVSATLSGNIRYTFFSLIMPSIEISKTVTIPLRALE